MTVPRTAPLVCCVFLATIAAALTLSAGSATAGPAYSGDVRASVVGGANAEIAARPYQAGLLDSRAPSPYDGQYCGAVILDATHVATAAHCAVLDGPTPQVKPARDIRVLAGTAILRTPGEPLAPEERQVDVTDVRLHPDYTPSTRDADVAVLTTATPLYDRRVPSSDAIAPISLQSEVRATVAVSDQEPAVLSGWGFTGSAAPGAPRPDSTAYPRQLQVATLRLVPDASCATQFKDVNPITSRMVCAGGSADPAACYGDSGGPLTDDRGEGPPALAGIVSFGAGCSQSQYPDVFTRVSAPDIAAFLDEATATAGDEPSSSPPLDPAVQSGVLPDAAPSAPTPSNPVAPPVSASPAEQSAPSPASGNPSVSDATPPTQHLIRKRCNGIRCVFNVQISDSLPSSGVRELYVRQRWVSKRRCRRHRRVTHCPMRVARSIPARSLGAGRFLIRVRRLISRGSIINLTAIDRAGNAAERSGMILLASRRHVHRAARRAHSKRSRRLAGQRGPRTR